MLIKSLRGGGQIEFNQIESCFLYQIESFIYTRSNFFCVFTRSKVLIMHLIQCQKLWVLILALDQKFLKPRINTIIRTFNLLPKKNLQLFHQIKSLNNALKSFNLVIKVTSFYFGTRSKVFKAKNTFLELLIQCQKLYVLIWHQIECIIKAFDLLPKILAVDQTHY